MAASSAPTYPVFAANRDKNAGLQSMEASKLANDASFDGDDSEAETERLHESPTKKRLANEVLIAEAKKQKLVDTDEVAASPVDPDLKSDQEDKVPSQTPSKNEDSPIETPDTPAKSSAGEEAEDSSGEGALNETDGEEELDDEGQLSDRETNEDRIQALKALTEIEVELAHVRDSLHDQHIAKFDLEILMCSEGSHPELEQYKLQINEDYNTRLKRTRSLLSYQMNAIYTQSQASRCSVYQTFLKSKISLRNELLNEVTRRWYQLNHERRKRAINSPEFGYVASSRPHKIERPTANSLRISQHSGLMNFPMAPRISQVTDTECDEDFHDIGLR